MSRQRHYDVTAQSHEFHATLAQAKDQLDVLSYQASSHVEYIDRLTLTVDARGPVARIEYIAEGHQIKMEVR